MTDDLPSDVHWSLPAWAVRRWRSVESPLPAIEDRMRLAIELSAENVRQGTGGPFGAAVFDGQTHRLVAIGVNLVLHAGASCAHAEVVALTLAQARRGHYSLGVEGLAPCELVSTTEPCAMCQGAVVWSGVRTLICGASDADARAVGFDEGPKPADWRAAFERRGIRVQCGVLQSEAAAVLRHYADTGGRIYNPF